MRIDWREGIDSSLLDLRYDQLATRLDGPTLFHIPGRREPPLFVSVLMHGNEPVGWDAARELLARWGRLGRQLPRSMYLLVANPAAAAVDIRHLPDQPDYNRIWPGTAKPELAESGMIRDLVNKLVASGLFASVDLHNNTGMNPHYACINRLRAEDLYLASLFSRTLVYFTRPTGVASIAMSEHCPAVTLECGKSGQEQGVTHAIEFLEACLHAEDLAHHRLEGREFDIYHTTAIVRVPEHLTFAFHDTEQVDLQFREDLDRLNFRELDIGSRLGRVNSRSHPPLIVESENGEDFDYFFRLQGTQLETAVKLMPSMLTLNHTNIRQDCLCYLMERVDAAYVQKQINHRR